MVQLFLWGIKFKKTGVFSEGVPRRSAFEVLESTSAFVKEQVTPDLINEATKEGELNRFCKDQFKEVSLSFLNLFRFFSSKEELRSE